ncbi:DegV family protein [uncultured Senegalimassilia sp.]|uniref:DegV family protein n=1 Tax=uncultured Senegalimassilia sp. TaxID=1714350 RepID=UPI002588515C|nr:DegV family protein [uncultured Senegalimassilia sp.]
MTMSFELVTDSCCNLAEETIDRYGLHVLPLTFMADGEDTVYQSYLKGEKTDLSRFYKMMRDGKVFRTSLPNLSNTETLFRSLLDTGRDILYLGFSSGLSGTYEATELLVKQLRGEYPDRKIYTVDTLAASGGQGLLVWHACQHAEAGEGIDAVRDWVEGNKLRLAHWFTVDDLMFLWRGGRVSKTSAWAGTLLNIKPVLHVDDEGHLIPMEKVRGRKKSLTALLNHMEKTGTQPLADQMVFITHGDCLEEAQWLEQQIRDRFGVRDIVVNCIDPVIGAHSGPGTMALFFLASNRN